MKRLAHFASLLLLFSGILPAIAQTSASSHPDLVLNGDVRGSQNHTYVEVPFQVPPGLERVTITYAYTGREQRTALDLGLLDPVKLRCWSGGNKSMLTVATSDATPSCLPGSIPAGTWKVLLGVPNIRPQVTSHYTIQVFFTRTGLVADEPAILREPLRNGPAWYRGDLHMHTGHSDGQCPSQTGKMVPCPVFVTVEAAVRRGLDFIAITDHNATSQYDAMRELQPYFDKLLLIPGREITTFYGHMNLLGTTQFFDFRLGSSHVPTVNDLLRSARATGALLSINHPDLPSGEICFGCGWTPPTPVDMKLVNAIEVVNGGGDNPAQYAVSYWERQLNQGFRLTAVGGSDNHRPMTPFDRPASVGTPTTVVYAANLSTPAILAGIRAGHVYVDVAGTTNRTLEFTAAIGADVAHMGDELSAPTGTQIALAAKASAIPAGSKIEILEDGRPMSTESREDNATAQNAEAAQSQWTSDGHRHWFRVNVTGPEGKLLLLGNPIYLNWTSPQVSAEKSGTK